MTTFAFTIVLPSGDMTEQQVDKLYGVCKDGTLLSDGPDNILEVERPAASLDQAIRSATADVEAADLQVQRIVIDPRTLDLLAPPTAAATA
jgi:hypothetical protein